MDPAKLNQAASDGFAAIQELLHTPSTKQDIMARTVQVAAPARRLSNGCSTTFEHGRFQSLDPAMLKELEELAAGYDPVKALQATLAGSSGHLMSDFNDMLAHRKSIDVQPRPPALLTGGD
jgi:hypothetical protein